MESRVLLLISALFLPNCMCVSTNLEDRAGWLSHGNETECFERIGCLTNSDGWYKLKRPFNPFPSSREAVGTNFKLYTRENKEGEELKVDKNDDIQSKYFKSDRETKLIIHGFLGKGKADWVMDMMEALLQRMDANVVIVDWSKGASTLYTYAAANTRVVGLEIAYLINTLIEKKGASARMFHLIGHSLGSHISGYAGERIHNLGRITGLDPAGPYFEDMPTFVRLDPSDAILVDTIHTDASMGFGTSQQMGDLDFYPNGGKNQPGCFITETEESLSDLPSCSHSRSELLFVESILSSPFYEDGKDGKCPFISFTCESYEDFLDGKCLSCGKDGMNCALMGLDADKYPGLSNPEMKRKKFYLETNGAEPYCGYHYHVNLTVAKESKGQDKVVGDLALTATGETGIAKEMELTTNGARTMSKGESYSFLGFSSVQTGKVSTADVKWKWNPDWFSSSICIFCNKNLYLSEAEVTDLGYYPQDKFKTSETCQPSEPEEIDSGDGYAFQLKC
ncbi:hypothetical protein J437_LFUL009398 [Ladona fulva]|uniref:Lipase domain-containing protein n=1 Tax=Ladona fulva TaxID=123851 RepID=A0A8K0K6N7_LADFU|nr:hypothetical protein J437_LFUL009398 [Ladona fulva]